METVDDYADDLRQRVMRTVKDGTGGMVYAGASDVEARLRAEQILRALSDDLRHEVNWIVATSAGT